MESTARVAFSHMLRVSTESESSSTSMPERDRKRLRTFSPKMSSEKKSKKPMAIRYPMNQYWGKGSAVVAVDALSRSWSVTKDHGVLLTNGSNIPNQPSKPATQTKSCGAVSPPADSWTFMPSISSYRGTGAGSIAPISCSGSNMISYSNNAVTP
jgi:hypothetical protein